MKILVVDDHALIREALRGVLKELKDDATVLEAADYGQAMGLLQQHSDLDLLLLDLGLPDKNGFDALAELRDHDRAIPVVVLSAFNDRANVVKALDLGALGFIPKSAPRAVMLGALNLVFSGGIYIPPDALEGRGAAPAAPQPRAEPTATNGPRSKPADSKPADLGLTERQVAVLALMMRGKSNKAICRVLDLAEPTVKNHVTGILKALNVTNRTEAVIKVGELGWELPEIGG
ncbi:MAG TPA: response regulator transcription factor [Methyloceanibacter sp.]|jgi:DNA-binding NarL/FixJ family response regulator|nr:response regulator transcription factor [Methyloceanibacter sp.]